MDTEKTTENKPVIPVFRFDGHTYTHTDVEQMRRMVIQWRNSAMDQWPESIDFTIGASHLIALLHHLLEYYPND